MSIRRFVAGALVSSVIASVGPTASAQLGGLLKKVPKAPSLPAAPAPPKHSFECSQIDEALVDKFLKGQEARKKVQDEEAAKGKGSETSGEQGEAQKAEADALRSAADAANVPFGHGKSGADKKADKAEQDITGLDDYQRGVFVECCIGVLRQDAGVVSQTPAKSRDALTKRADELKVACGA
jgi:type IV secretory pathway VirB10-like protein